LIKSLLEIKDVTFAYEKDKTFLDKISFMVNEEDILAIIGRNGSGKSTLVKIISRIINNFSGSVVYAGKDVKNYDNKSFSRNVSYLPQVFPAYVNELKVYDLLLLGRYAYKKSSQLSYCADDIEVAERAMEVCGVTQYKEKTLKTLSGGERQKILLTLSLVQLDITRDLKGKILIVDEPLTHLDINFQYETLSLLKDLNEKKGLTVIFVIHDLNLALKYSSKTLLMNKGRLVAFGETRSIISSENINKNFLVSSELVSYNNNTFIHYNDI
jgi:iron complex transport system ATP-binding protein